MAEICCDVVTDADPSVTREPSPRAARRRRMEIRRFKVVAGVAPLPESACCKRQKTEASAPFTVPSPRECNNAFDNSGSEGRKRAVGGGGGGGAEARENTNSSASLEESAFPDRCPKFGMSSVCGRRRDMEDAVSIHPSFCQRQHEIPGNLHFFAVYDGHGCSHVAMSCRDRLHRLVAEEISGDREVGPTKWKDVMERSFQRMDMEVMAAEARPKMEESCRCEKQTPQCDAVGSTAVVAVVSTDKIVVANCGDSRAVLCRNGKPVPLSSDHKPDRADELQRIQAAGGRVIFWDGPRVLGVLAMSRAIGDSYLKPFVSSVPEVTVTERSPGDECLILASDGLWDVVSNSMACDIVRMCLRGRAPLRGAGSEEEPDKACLEASVLLTKLALARQSTDNVSIVIVNLRK